MDGNRTGRDQRGSGPARRQRAIPVEHGGWIAVVLVAPALGWISPVLLVVVAVAVGIGWLCVTGADPVHWRPAADVVAGERHLDGEDPRRGAVGLPPRSWDGRSTGGRRRSAGARGRPFVPAVRDRRSLQQYRRAG